ncbi:BglG family transcription antiterminator [Bacillaceae bacterium C204]|uniref:BglG family transcription antiterminator n=1 Tax=Neobacillus sp. 204 TaxID=3383351 RepID=UPI00397E58BC
MNGRQKRMLKILLDSTSDFLSSQQMADQLNCSEKTVRNDSKILDQWLSKHSTATLTRKPNIGFRLEINDQAERNSLLNSLYNVQTTTYEVEEKDRLASILELLLLEKKPVTLQRLSEQFFINKAIIKKDIEKIEAFLATANLTLTTKKKLGIEVEGPEQNWRLAISKIPLIKEPNEQNRSKFWEQLFENQDIHAVTQSLEEVNQQSANPYTDETLQSLLVHILISIKRLKLGNTIHLPAAEVAQISVKKEFSIALKALKQLEPHFALRFPQNEIAYIALHFMGGKVQNVIHEKNDVDEEVKMITRVLVQQISAMIHIDFSEDEDLIQGLYVHLQSSLNRIWHGLSVTNPILDQIKRVYPYLFDTIMNELVLLNKVRKLNIPEDEAAYLTLHFQASLERLQRRNGSNKRTIIVCPMGIGASVLLRTKLERKFHSLDIIDSVSIHKINQYSPAEIDFIIATVPIQNAHVPVIEVTPLLSQEEQNRLQAFIEALNDKPVHQTHQEGNFPFLRELVKEELIIVDLDYSHPYEIIEALATKLVQQGYVSEEYIESAIIREQHSSTNIGGGISIPHGDPVFIKKSGIAVGLLKRPLLWGKDYVSLVLMLSTKQEEYSKTKELFTEIGQLCDHPNMINNLIKQKTPEEFINSL